MRFIQRLFLQRFYFLGSFPQTEPASLFFTDGTLVLVPLRADLGFASFCLLAPLLNEAGLVPEVLGLSDFLGEVCRVDSGRYFFTIPCNKLRTT